MKTPRFGSAAETTSGTERWGWAFNAFWYDGFAKNWLRPKPPCPLGGVCALPFHQVSLPYVPSTPLVALEPPTAVMCGASAGTASVLALPPRHVLPLSPDPVTTVM